MHASYSQNIGTLCHSPGNGFYISLHTLLQVKSKQLVAASTAYAPREGLGLTVQEAVSLARGNAVAAAEAEADAAAAAEGKKDRKKFWERKGKAGTKEERTLSGRSDSAGSLDRV